MEELVLYTAHFCPKCQLAKKTLSENGYVFTASEDTEKALSLGIKVVPCLVVNASGNQYILKDILNICKRGGTFE